MVGEKLSVSELLYGLLLPSGNDASVALAEHFGTRLAEKSEGTADPLSSFIWAMNAETNRLGLTTTHFKNTHGITEAGHHTMIGQSLRWGELARSCISQDRRGPVRAMPSTAHVEPPVSVDIAYRDPR